MTKNYKRVYYKMSFYPPYKSSSNNIKVELDLTDYATKTDLNNITHVDTSSFASKTNLAASDLTGYAKKAEVATDITAIKNDYVTNASLTSQLNNLKSQHIATEVTGIDNKTKKMRVIF